MHLVFCSIREEPSSIREEAIIHKRYLERPAARAASSHKHLLPLRYPSVIALPGLACLRVIDLGLPRWTIARYVAGNMVGLMCDDPKSPKVLTEVDFIESMGYLIPRRPVPNQALAC